MFKPAGLTVFPLHADPESDCVLRRLVEREPGRLAIAWPQGFAGGIAHRLDRPTSGALLVADDPQELFAIRGAFRGGHFTKVYRFRSGGDVPWSSNHCDRPIAHARRNRKKMVVQRSPSTAHRGKWYAADTRFERLDGDLWRAVITTGVMHQIRVHAAFLGLSLTGDRLYGGGGEGDFQLHHDGLSGPFQTTPVVTPSWGACSARR